MSEDTPPRLPRACPVVCLHLRADNGANGNPRRLFAIVTPGGQLVEVHDEGYRGEAVIWSRWPWFHSSRAVDAGVSPAYAVPVNVAPAEYKRWMRRDVCDWSPEVDKLRRMADRASRWQA